MVFEFPFSKTNLPKQLFINNEVTRKTKQLLINQDMMKELG